MTALKPIFAAFPLTSADQGVPEELFRDLRANAAPEEAGTSPISRSIDLLRDGGLMADDGAVSPARTARTLMHVGGANLCVGRLYEGHVNALRLITLYGSDELKSSMARRIADGAVLGVWGADGQMPVTADEAGSLSGSKAFASGLGTVTHAVVTVNSGPEVRLALVDVSDETRADLSSWDTLGMKATASGEFDFTGMPKAKIEWIGAPGDYLQEPHFVGGVWRIAALQAGGAAGLLDVAASELRAAGRMEAEAQAARLMGALTQVWAGMALTERAAESAADGQREPEDIVATSIAARLFTEEAGLDAIRAVEQSIGLRHFKSDTETGRMARDLSMYMRQAARDAFLQRAAQNALGQEGKIWGAFS
ncbi:acyl-CoA dehydrogenase [Gymnodinialimonas ceratoperidinii]|uniref:Acyl-CoA dehydrogenase n=1 Tax=Gymnodinialimonas ceratoperidinii TaxID=2856823 RepID=A0A8F6TWL1_9RHOB|nr:acyl-CoA dehydrogenase [Gymnodinialimonas ceratoperidinii]QXT39046.1 acyl-CoA dehydrogenase [Gymnodinialimonas ceratoperidinii]